MSKVKEAIDELSENNTKIPTVEEVANYVNLPFDKVEEIMNIELIKNMEDNTLTSKNLKDIIDKDKEESREQIRGISLIIFPYTTLDNIFFHHHNKHFHKSYKTFGSWAIGTSFLIPSGHKQYHSYHHQAIDE